MDNLSKLEKLLEMMDTKSTMDEFLKVLEVLVAFAEELKVGNDSNREELSALIENKMDEAIEKAKSRILEASNDEWQKIKDRVDLIKDGETPTDEKLTSLIKSLIPPPVPGKTPTKEEIQALIPPAQPGPPGSPDTPEEVVEKVNTGTTLIKKERVEGLADIERIAKANATPAGKFNPTMGPSFSDLKNIQTQVDRGKQVSINFIIDGGGSALTTGVKGFVEIPYAMTITGWQIFADQSGSVVVDVWKDSYANFPPTGADSIAGTEKPTLSSAQKNADLSLSTWNTSLTAGDILAYNVDSISSITRVTVTIIGVKI